MIIDKIKNSKMYHSLHPGIAEGLKFLASADFNSIAPGKYEIQGDEIFVIVQDYQTQPKEEKRWEAHRKYIDIQYIASGAELMGYANIDKLDPVTEYDSAKDIIFLEGKGDFLEAQTGTFVILAPDDAHMPGVDLNGTQDVRKAVVKVML
jgi:YhcH/YjgK/YiaL family protein